MPACGAWPRPVISRRFLEPGPKSSKRYATTMETTTGHEGNCHCCTSSRLPSPLWLKCEEYFAFPAAATVGPIRRSHRREKAGPILGSLVRFLLIRMVHQGGRHDEFRAPIRHSQH